MSKPKIKLLGYRALVRLDKIDLPKGIVLAEQSKDVEERKGIVEVLGDGRHNFEGAQAKFDVKVGDHVLMSEYAVYPYFDGDVEYRIVNANDIIAIIP